MEFDYQKLVQEMMKQMQGSVAGISLQDFTNEYLAFTKTNRSKKTAEGVELVNKKLLQYFSPLRKIETIEIKEAEQFLDALKKNAPKGVYNYHRVLRAMWNKAKEWNYARENPFEKMKLNKRQSTAPTFVSEEQLEVLFKKVENEVVRDVIITAFYTGCRLGELINLRWQDVDLKNDLITIGNSEFDTKSRKQRVVPMHERVREVLSLKVKGKMLNRENGPTPLIPLRGGENEPTPIIPLPRGEKLLKRYVFGKSNGQKFTGDYFSRRFKRACRKAGMDEKLHFHCLRHGAITKMILNGAPLPAVQRIAGHANIQTTMIYTHPSIEDLREAVNRL